MTRKFRLLESFSPKTLSNDEVVSEWIGMFNHLADQDHPGADPPGLGLAAG